VPTDHRLRIWIRTLAIVAATNVVLWTLVAVVTAPHTRYVIAQLGLSAIYVSVCGFRSLYPRVDLERICLWDTWLSAITLGRTAATIAELCFAWQCALFVDRMSVMAGVPLLRTEAALFVPLAVIAEVMCWYAVASLNHIGHAIEESLWAVLMLLLAVAFGLASTAAHGSMRPVLTLGMLAYGAGAALTLTIDVPMYLRRWRRGVPSGYLPIATGLRDSHTRRHPTAAWATWRAEVPWMTLYFSVGAWTSLAMVCL
jgi:hypothetical protein